MKRFITFLFVSLCCLSALIAQEVPDLTEITVKPEGQIKSDIPQAVQLHLNLNSSFELEETFVISSKTANHHHYTVLLNGKPVYGSRVHAVVSPSGAISKIIYNKIPTNRAESNTFPVNRDQSYQDFQEAQEILGSKEVWIPKGEMLVPGRALELSTPSELHKLMVYTEEGVVYEVDNVKRHRHSGPKDTTVSVMVFNPDPLTSAGTSYGPPYVDADDSDVPALNAQRKLRYLRVGYTNGTFILENNYARIKNLSPPNIAPATSSSPDFHFTRSQSGFEDVNALYHITQFSEHIHELGYTNIPGYQIDVDPHALNGTDNSLFMSNASPKRILFGEGKVDDAEDADVIIHEFTHACILAASGSNSGTTERNTIEESLGDYFAASYSVVVSGNIKDGVFNWDGQNPFWPGREVSSNKDYQELSFTDIYKHTDIWASCLMEIYSVLGREVTDELVMEAIFSLGSNTTMPKMAYHIIDADEALNGGVNRYTIASAFIRRNILDASALSVNDAMKAAPEVQVLNSHEFARGGELLLKFPENTILNGINLYDLSGKPLVSQVYGTEVLEAKLSSDDLAPGIYVLMAEFSGGDRHSVKLIRY